MQFIDKHQAINLTNVPTTFIYFLLWENEVVYVGQTTKGLQRVYAHAKDKVFDEIWVIETPESELNNSENYFIAKYQPMYNRVNNPIYERTANGFRIKYTNKETEYDTQNPQN